jgi:hypothetical protein
MLPQTTACPFTARREIALDYGCDHAKEADRSSPHFDSMGPVTFKRRQEDASAAALIQILLR